MAQIFQSLTAEGSQLSGCGFESRHRILDGFKLLQLKNNENISSLMGHTKKNIKKKSHWLILFDFQKLLLLSEIDLAHGLR